MEPAYYKILTQYGVYLPRKYKSLDAAVSIASHQHGARVIAFDVTGKIIRKVISGPDDE